MKKIILMALMAVAITSCNEGGQKTLILYYSQTGTTESLAVEIQHQIGADICRFDVEQVYDGTYEETIARCREERENGSVPDLKPLATDLSKYDVVFLGYPIWFGTYAPPVKSLLSVANFEGKTVVPFCTFGSGGLKSSMEDLRKALPNCDIRDGYGVRTARIAFAAEELNRFLIENGWKEGAVEPLPEFSGQNPVSEEDAAVFNAACSGYKYPIGTPVTVGKRCIPGGTEYKFDVEGFTPDGKLNKVIVLVSAVEGKNPEFTQVIR